MDHSDPSCLPALCSASLVHPVCGGGFVVLVISSWTRLGTSCRQGLVQGRPCSSRREMFHRCLWVWPSALQSDTEQSAALGCLATPTLPLLSGETAAIPESENG